MGKTFRSLVSTILVIGVCGGAAASDYLFLNRRYITLTRRMLADAESRAGAAFEASSEARNRFDQSISRLRAQLDAVTRGKLFKKLKPESVAEVKNKEFAEELNTFKFGLRAIAAKAGQEPAALFPAYEEWVKTETSVVSMGIDQRLQAFETRFGPDSEPINFLEFFLGEALLKGDESAPSPWEPILRLSAVHLTTAGPGLTSSFQAGLNHYFLQGPGFFRWIGLNNHVGVAASLQYLNDPRLMRFEGRPAFGVVLHLDRKEVGASWDPNDKTVRMTLGYSFQFIPLVL